MVAAMAACLADWSASKRHILPPFEVYVETKFHGCIQWTDNECQRTGKLGSDGAGMMPLPIVMEPLPEQLKENVLKFNFEAMKERKKISNYLKGFSCQQKSVYSRCSQAGSR